MKTELEPHDIEAIAQRVTDLLTPRILNICPREFQDTYLTVEEAAEFLGTSNGQIYQWVSNAKHGLSPHPIPYVKTGKRLKFSRQALTEWMTQAKRPPLESR